MNIYEKIAKVKEGIEPISKDITNDFYKSKYFDVNKLIEAIEGKLKEHELLLLQPIIDGHVVSQIINLSDTNEKLESAIKLPDINEPQKIGSAVTYYRRYSLQSLLGIIAEDDDANKTVKTDDIKPWLNPETEDWTNALHKKKTLDFVKNYYKISKANAEKYVEQLNTMQ